MWEIKRIFRFLIIFIFLTQIKSLLTDTNTTIGLNDSIYSRHEPFGIEGDYCDFE